MWLQAVCNLLSETQRYFNTAVAALQAAQPASHAGGPVSLNPPLELNRWLSDRLDHVDQQVGRQAQHTMEQPLQELEHLAPGVPRTYLARHLSALQHKDCASSLDYLHRYFDHVADPYVDQLGPAADGESGAAQQDRTCLQAASLSLSSMHAQFGHTEEAMAALNETVSAHTAAGCS